MHLGFWLQAYSCKGQWWENKNKLFLEIVFLKLISRQKQEQSYDR